MAQLKTESCHLLVRAEVLHKSLGKSYLRLAQREKQVPSLLHWKAGERLKQVVNCLLTEDTVYAAEVGGVGGASTAGL